MYENDVKSFYLYLPVAMKDSRLFRLLYNSMSFSELKIKTGNISHEFSFIKIDGQML